MKILIVDDNDEIREVIKILFRSDGTTFYECTDGNVVMTAYRQVKPDWVLMDVQMPGVNGITATGYLKKEFPEARIIIVSSFDGHKLREDAAAAGAISYFTKDNLIRLKEFIQGYNIQPTITSTN